jgi:hypothetical protein
MARLFAETQAEFARRRRATCFKIFEVESSTLNADLEDDMENVSLGGIVMSNRCRNGSNYDPEIRQVSARRNTTQILIM